MSQVEDNKFEDENIYLREIQVSPTALLPKTNKQRNDEIETIKKIIITILLIVGIWLIVMFTFKFTKKIQTQQLSNKKSTDLQTKSNQTIALPKQNPKQNKITDYNKKIYAGQIHYSRIPVEYWQHRIDMIKAMGLNSLSVYVMWNFHEIKKGLFDFQTQNRNLTKFLELSLQKDMKVLIRPGPYVCAQWDFGGLPARLLGDSQLVIRSNNLPYIRQVRKYFEELANVIRRFLPQNKGPIHMVQIQNELGSFTKDPDYVKSLIKIWQQLKVYGPFYAEDGISLWQTNYVAGLHLGISQGEELKLYEIAESSLKNKEVLVFGGESYSGWLTHWGEDWNEKSNSEFSQQFQKLIQKGKQFSLYVAHGGTNFGLTAGANGGLGRYNYQPAITSYDYDAPITENGQPNNKFISFRNSMQKFYESLKIPQIPQTPYPSIFFNVTSVESIGNLLQNLPQPHIINSTQLYFFEHDQIQLYRQGFALYQCWVPFSQKSYNIIMKVHDFGMIYLNAQLKKEVTRSVVDNFNLNITCQTGNKCLLEVLVQAMGHINYGKSMKSDKKGLLQFRLQNSGLHLEVNWNITKIEIEDVANWGKTKMKMSSVLKTQPTIYKGNLNLQNIGDTYFNMAQFQKGYLWVNGRILGRFWRIGPQLRLYCPGVWLRKGLNEVLILDIKGVGKKKSFSGVKSLK